jgi:hypothetical protein
MNPAQNLIAIAHCYITDRHHLLSGSVTLDVDLGALDGDGVHPQAAGPKLFLSERPGYKSGDSVSQCLKLKGLGRHIALWCSLMSWRPNADGSVDMFTELQEDMVVANLGLATLNSVQREH